MKNKIIILMTIFSIMFITVAWASFSTILTISGEATIETETTPPVCGAWKLRPSTLTYAEATAQDAFIDPGTNNTWTDDSLILSVDCTDNTGCQADHYDVKTYNTTTKTDSNALTQVIQDAFSNQTTCTLPVGGSNPYVDKDAPVLTELYVTPMDGEFKTSMNLIDVSTYPAFKNIDGAYYTYEGKSFIGTGVNNVIISENIASQAKYASASGTDNGEGSNPRYTFSDSPAADAAVAYCSGCRLMTKDEAIAWDSAAGTGNSTKRIVNYNGSAYSWWLADAGNTSGAWDVYINGVIDRRSVTSSFGVRPVVSISNTATMSGSGTQGDPYVILPANTRPTVYTGYEQSGIVSTQFYYKRCGDQNWTALTKNTFTATTTKAYTDWYIPSNNNTSTSCLSSAWGTYYFKVDTEDAVGNTKTYYSKKTTNSTNPVEGYTENENEMNQFALAPLKARNISYDNTGQPTLCTDVECAHDQLRYMFGLGLSYGITLDNRSATASGTETIYENYGDGFYLTNTNGTLSNKMTTSANAITVPTKSNNSFLGYYTETNGGGTQYIDANGNITANATASLKRSAKLYAKWRRTVFYIILDMASGTGGTEMIYVNYNDGFYLNNTDGVLSNKMTTSTNALTIPTRVGYTFGGYYTGQNGAGTQIIDSTGKITSSASSTQFNTDEVLYANWNEVTLTFSDQTITKNYSTSSQTANVTTATGGVGPYTYSKVSGESDITVSSAGLITIPAGKSTSTSGCTVVIRVTDTGSGVTKDATYTIKIIRTFENIDMKHYTYEGKHFIGTGVNNIIILYEDIGAAKYATAYATKCSDGSKPTNYACPSGTTPVFSSKPATDAAAAYCTGCRLMTYNEALAWDSTAGTGSSSKRKGNHNWWLADAYNAKFAYDVGSSGSIGYVGATSSSGYYVRPVVDISSSATMSGTGTQASPYVITLSQ